MCADREWNEDAGRLPAFRALFASAPVPMWVYDADTCQFLEVNDAALEVYGYSRDEFLAMTLLDIRPPDEVPKLRDYLTAHRAPLRRAGTWRHRTKGGAAIDVEITSHAVVFRDRAAVVVAAVDVSERQRLQEQLMQSQKMEAVGQLAGGIAHDFNNLLTTIQGYCDLALDNPLLPSPFRADLEEIKHCALSASSLTKQLLAFSRRQIIDPVVLDLNGVLRRLEGMLQRLIGEDIRVVFRLDPALKAVRIDPVQVEQIVMNLAINARDAMPDGGTLTLETTTVVVDDTWAGQQATAAPGEYVMLAVSDTGTGMSADVLAHVFEPFFTTKAAGKGSGLGLATVYGNAAQNGGSVAVSSEPGRGATFRIYLPALARGEAAAVAAKPIVLTTPVGTETVLVVEDDARLRLLAQKSLERFGYVVLARANGYDALRVAETDAGPIDVLVTDVVMPGMNGKELARQFAALRPAARVLFCSGYTEDAIVHHGVLDPEVAFLQKPYSPTALAQKVRDVLDAPAEHG